MATGRYVLSDDGKYAIELIDDEGYPNTFSYAEIVAKNGGAGLSKYNPIGATAALLADENVTKVKPEHIRKTSSGKCKLMYLVTATSDYAEDGSSNTDGSTKDYYNYQNTWKKRVTFEEWEHMLLDPIRDTIQELREDMEEGFAQAAAERLILSNRISANSVLIAANTSLINALTSRVDTIDTSLQATINRVVILEENANAQAAAFANHEVRIVHLEGRTVSGFTTTSTGAVILQYAGAGGPPLTGTLTVTVGSGGTGGSGGSGGSGGTTTPQPGDYLESGHKILNHVRDPNTGDRPANGPWVISASTSVPPADAKIWPTSIVANNGTLDEYANVIASIDATTGQVAHGNSLPTIIGNYTNPGGHYVFDWTGAGGTLLISRFGISNLKGKVGPSDILLGARLKDSNLIVNGWTTTNLEFESTGG